MLLHGLFRSAFSMMPLEWYLEKKGYRVINKDYDSISHPIEQLAEFAVGQGIADCQSAGSFRTHFVTHSLGGILVRQYASLHPLPGDTRVVMLGPPNQGSQVAEYYGAMDLVADIGPVAIEQLGGGLNSLPAQLGPVDFQLGIIAGNLRNTTLLPGFPDQPSDGTVSITESKVTGMRDFLELPVLHTSMIWNPGVWSQAIHFLEEGMFQHPLR